MWKNSPSSTCTVRIQRREAGSGCGKVGSGKQTTVAPWEIINLLLWMVQNPNNERSVPGLVIVELSCSRELEDLEAH